MPNGKTRRAEKQLTAAFVNSVTEPGKYHDGGNLGLYLRVDPNLARFWVQRIVVRAKRCEIGLGSFPAVSLAKARQAATENKTLARAGGDPLDARRKVKETLTFADAVEKYLEKKSGEFRNDKHRKQWRSTLDTYAAPVLGRMALDAIEVRHVQRVLEPIWTTKTETASRLRGRIEAVLSWATVGGHRSGDNPARWGGNLKELLGKPSKLADKGNHPALGLADLPRWWADLRAREGTAARSLELLTLTAARSGEVRGMTWGEVDMEARLWTVPASRMKAGREHRVPLTDEAVAVLRRVAGIEEGREFVKPKDDALVFAAPRGGTLSDMSISAVMRRMQETEEKAGKAGYLDPRSKRAAVPHGLRSSFRDWAAEQGVERDMAEIALAHNVGSEVERSYRRTDMLERRRAMMDQWARCVRGDARDRVVVPISGARASG